MDRVMQDGTIEFLDVTVTVDLPLIAQPVAISFDRETWLEASWIGAEGPTRAARVLLDGAAEPPARTLPAPGQHIVYVRVTTDPEIPVMPAGTLTVK